MRRRELLKLSTAVIGGVTSAALAGQKDKEPLPLVGKVPLPGVKGAMNHLAVDYIHARLFLAAVGNNSIEVLDIRTNSSLGSIPNVTEPQDIAYLKSSNRIFVTKGGVDTLQIFDGSTLQPGSSVPLGRDADHILTDAANGRIYVGYGDGVLAVLDPSGKVLGDVALKAHPKSFELATNAARLYVNLPAKRIIAVVDLSSLKVMSEWPINGAQDNSSMAIDESNRRVFVTCERPPRLLVFDMDSGVAVAQLATVGDPNDLFYDAIHSRVYVIGGQGQIGVYAQEAPDRYVVLDSVATVAGARTGLFVPEWNRLFVAVRQFGNRQAEIRIYQPQ